MRDVWVLGVGMTPFGRFPAQAVEELAQAAAWDAARDAGMALDGVEAVFCGHVFQGRVAGQRVARDLGLDGRFLVNVENACASGATALHLAWQAVAGGAVDLALALGFEQLSAFGRGVVPPDRHDLEGALGRTNPATYALMARRHMAEFGTTLEQLAAVAVKAHRNGARNPRAQIRNEISTVDVLQARLVAEPLTRLHCCPTGDGAAAAVVSSSWQPGAVRILASVVRGGLRRPAGDSLVSHPVTRRTAETAYRLAGVDPLEIDVAEVHDAFTIAEIVHAEDLGFCPKGEGGPFTATGATAIDGERPLNPSGGLLARGHPLGASGLAQVFEIVEQLRGRADGRQVAGARVGLTHCEGGIVYGLDAGACAIHIFAV